MRTDCPSNARSWPMGPATPPRRFHRRLARSAGINLLALVTVFAALAVDAAPLPASEPQVPPPPAYLAPIDTRGLRVETRLNFGFSRHQIETNGRVTDSVILRVENGVGRRLKGVWEIAPYERPNRPARIIRRPMELAPGDTKRLAVAAYFPDNRGEVVARFRVDGRVLWQRDIAASTPPAVGYSGVGGALRILQVDPKGRRPNWNTEARRALGDTYQRGIVNTMPGPGERPITTTTILGWELPDAAQPLFRFHGVALARALRAETLTEAQRAALLTYLQHGGVLILPSAQTSMSQWLLGDLPPTIRARVVEAEVFAGRRDMVGASVYAGAVLATRESVFARGPEARAARETVAEALAVRPEPSFPNWLGIRGYGGPGLGEESILSLVAVVGLFLIYALVTGPIALLALRKASRKAVARFVVLTLAIFCGLALLLGPALSLWPGSVRWLSITQATEDGGVQQAILTLESAGAHTHNLDFGGGQAVWLLPDELRDRWSHRYYYGHQTSIAECLSVPDTMLPMDADPRSDPHRLVDASITPWSQRLALATALAPSARPFPVEVTGDSSHGNDLVVSVTNDRKFAITDYAVRVTAWTGNNQRNNQQNGTEASWLISGTDKLYPGGTVSIPLSRYGGRRQDATTWSFESTLGLDRGKRSAGWAQLEGPHANVSGVVRVELLVRLPESPALHPKGMFFNRREGVHIWIQPIPIKDKAYIRALTGAEPRPIPAW